MDLSVVVLLPHWTNQLHNLTVSLPECNTDQGMLCVYYLPPHRSAQADPFPPPMQANVKWAAIDTLHSEMGVLFLIERSSNSKVCQQMEDVPVWHMGGIKRGI